MIKKYATKQLQINANIGGHKKDTAISIDVDKNGTPIVRYWRDRIKDAKIDNCVEFIKPAKNKKKEK